MEPSPPPAPGAIRAIFSDLDGTIVHFPKWFEAHGVTMPVRQPEASRCEVLRASDGAARPCRLLPESTMGDGVVSDRTVELVAQLRAEGILFVIVTGARKSTTLERLPMLPAADAVVCETGSRIYLGTTPEALGGAPEGVDKLARLKPAGGDQSVAYRKPGPRSSRSSFGFQGTPQVMPSP